MYHLCRIVPLLSFLFLLAIAFQVACDDGEATGVAPDPIQRAAANPTPSMPTGETPTATRSPSPMPTVQAVSAGSAAVSTATATPPPTRRPDPAPTPAPLPLTPGILNFPNPQVSDVSDGSQREPIDFDIGEATLWRDVIAKLKDGEVACIRRELGEERYQWVLERPAVQEFVVGMTTDEPWAEIWQVLLWGCLEQETAVDLFWGNLEGRIDEVIDTMREGSFAYGDDVELFLAEECLRGMLAYTHFSRFVAGGLPGKSWQSRAHENDELGFSMFFLGLYFCVIPLSEEDGSSSFSSEYDISWDDVANRVTEGESSCIRGALGLADEPAIGQQVFNGRTEPWGISAWGCLSRENAAHLFEASDPYQEFIVSKAKILEYGGDDIDCIREALHKVDYTLLAADSLPGTDPLQGTPYFALVTALAHCQSEALSGYENYNKDKIGEASLSPGISASGAVNYPADIDVFSIEVEQGKIYQVNVMPGTLQYPLAGRYDSSYRFSDLYFTSDRYSNEDGSPRLFPIRCYSTAKEQEFPLEWKAERSELLQIIVWGGSCDDLGTYKLTLSESEGE